MAAKLSRTKMVSLLEDVLPLMRSVQKRVDRDQEAFHGESQVELTERWLEDLGADDPISPLLGIYESIEGIERVLAALKKGQYRAYFA